ncbi:hypothetical protein C9374_007973 [Naegleria lovaniensis]|uniref:Response regulatory domain-containing protein n=1 Tax=Naegleria lovaniensis TaxID=51637 RepID=A0AA88GKL1_NAELO|nr:uncharacterized protein C9374_007973 [Naegleria lovaniensis]KAG2378825.1 hypothetical protein C9374_007973 [Naegleria lovaniensis]
MKFLFKDHLEMTRYFVLIPSREFRTRNSSPSIFRNIEANDPPNDDEDVDDGNLHQDNNTTLSCQCPFIILLNDSSFLPKLQEFLLHFLLLFQTTMYLLLSILKQFFRALFLNSSAISSCSQFRFFKLKKTNSQTSISLQEVSPELSSHSFLQAGDAQESLPAVKVEKIATYTQMQNTHEGPPHKTKSKLKILIAESNTIHRMVLIKLLKLLGQDIELSMNDGKQLLDQTNHNLREIDIVFLDEHILEKHPSETWQFLHLVQNTHTKIVLFSKGVSNYSKQQEEENKSRSTSTSSITRPSSEHLLFTTIRKKPKTIEELDQVIREVHSKGSTTTSHDGCISEHCFLNKR